MKKLLAFVVMLAGCISPSETVIQPPIAQSPASQRQLAFAPQQAVIQQAAFVDPPLQVTITGTPLAGTYTAYPIAPYQGDPKNNQLATMWIAVLSSGSTQARIQVTRASDKFFASCYVLNAAAGSGGAYSGPNPNSSAPIEIVGGLNGSGTGNWNGQAQFGAPSAITISISL